MAKMNRVKLDMTEINAANNVIEERCWKLDIFTEQIVDNDTINWVHDSTREPLP